MPISVIDTVGSVSANSYVSTAYATTYVDVYALTESQRDVWANTGVDDRARAIIIASRDLDMYMLWDGTKATSTQSMEWPRAGTSYSTTEIPESLRQAVVEFALWRLQNDSPVTDMVAFDSLTVGPIKIDYNDNMTGASRKYVPDIVLTRLKNLGSLDVPSDTMTNMARQVKLVRT
jgi:hypothetical protein